LIRPCPLPICIISFPNNPGSAGVPAGEFLDHDVQVASPAFLPSLARGCVERLSILGGLIRTDDKMARNVFEFSKLLVLPGLVPA
jgi:hypothetical protein